MMDTLTEFPPPFVRPLAKRDPYWEKRKDSIYLYAAQAICKKYAPKPVSVLDVGSNKTPTLEWHRKTAKKLVSIDLNRPYEAEGVQSIVGDFFAYFSPERFDLVTCFQVLEHIPDPKPFAQKILKLGKVCVVSVPYNWEEGKCRHHIHDPVNGAKMLTWFECKPKYQYVAKELNKISRLVQVYTT